MKNGYYADRYILPPHEVQDAEKVMDIVEAALAGEQIPPVVAYRGAALNGSHRLAAKEILEDMGDYAEIEIVELEDIENKEAAEAIIDAMERGVYSNDLAQDLLD